MSFDPIADIIEDIRQGKMVILVDDEDRENEGDLVMAASWVRPEDINFMARYGRGLICLTLTQERCEQLRLPLMVDATHAKHLTNFTVSIEAAEGVSTGISAADRARTIRVAVAPHAQPSDLVQPGHIFPLMAQPGGVLTRAGHTEAGCDLAALAGLEPAAVIVEILNEDGTMARRPQLEAFAQEHRLKIGSIEDLIRYRLANERTVTPVTRCRLPTPFGEFTLAAYEDVYGHTAHFALVLGDISPDRPTLVRVHLQDSLSDVLGVERHDCGLPLQKVFQRLSREGNGVIVVLRPPEDPRELLRRVRNYQLQDEGVEIPQPAKAASLRTYGVGAQILYDLGVRRMRVLGAPRKFHALAGFGLTIEEYVECE